LHLIFNPRNQPDRLNDIEIFYFAPYSNYATLSKYN